MNTPYTLKLSVHHTAFTSKQIQRLGAAFAEAADLFGKPIDISVVIVNGHHLNESLESLSKALNNMSRRAYLDRTIKSLDSLAQLGKDTGFSRTGKGERKRNSRNQRKQWRTK